MGEKQVINLPVAGGVNEKLASEWLDPNSNVASVYNANLIKEGAADKRVGMQYVSTTSLIANSNNGMSPPTTATAVQSWSKSNLTLMSPGNLYSYSNAEAALVPVGPLPPCRTVRRPLVVNSESTRLPVLVDFPGPEGSTLRMALYNIAVNITNEPQIVATVYDANTGDIVIPEVLVYFGQSTNAAFAVNAFYLPNAPAGSQVQVFIYDAAELGPLGGRPLLYAIPFNPAANAFGGKVLVAQPSLPTTFDVSPWFGDPNGRYVVASDVSGGSWYYYVYTATGTLQTINPLTSSYPSGYSPQQIYLHAHYGTGERIYFYYQFFELSGVHVRMFIQSITGDGTFTQVLSETSVYSSDGTIGPIIMIPPIRSQKAWVLFGYLTPQNTLFAMGSLNSWNGVYQYALDTGLTATSPYPLGYFPVARPFVQSGTIYMPTVFTLYAPAAESSAYQVSGQGTLYLLQFVQNSAVDFYNAVPVATVAPRQVDQSFLMPIASYPTMPYTPWSSAAYDGATRFAVAIHTLSASSAGSPVQNAPVLPTWACDFFFDSTSQSTLYQSNELGQELRIAGAVPFISDGQITFEDSFFYYPEYVHADIVSGSGLVGIYQYAVCYVYVDASGKMNRSVPVFSPTSVTSDSSHNPRCNFPAYTTTWRDMYNPGQVYAEIYRTTAGQSVFYLEDRMVASNQPSAVYLHYVSLTPDAELEESTILYTTGGVLDQPNPPAAMTQCVWLDRLFIVDETLRNVWFTQQDSAGLTATFNEALTFTVPDGGDITGLIGMSNSLIIFKAQSIWVVNGQTGPSSTGQGNDITLPQRIPSDVGCVTWQSIVLTPAGVFFQASSGLYLLDQGLNVTYVGHNVRDTLAKYPTITSATLVPSTTHVRFTCTGASGSITICYDYFFQQWLYHSYAELAENTTIASSCIDQSGLFTFATTDGAIWREKTSSSSTQYQDDDMSSVAHFVSTSIVFAWVKLRGVLGYMKARLAQLFAERQNDCGLTMSFAVNYDPTIVQTMTWPSTNLTDIANDLVEARVAGPYGKSTALQVTVADTVGTATTTGQGARFVSLNVEADNIGERYRQLPTARRA